MAQMFSGHSPMPPFVNAEGRRLRPDHPEDFGRGLLWQLAEALFLGVVLPSPPPVPRIRIDDEQQA